MSIDVPSKVKQLIKRIITEKNLKTKNIKYETGSENGEGFSATYLTVDINEDDKPLYLFCKFNVKMIWSNLLPIDSMFKNEIYFYNTIYPAYEEFLKEKSVEDGFRNVPKCYAVDEGVLVLENIKRRGFDLFEKGKIMNDKHILLTMKTLSKFHAISFAFKDQKSDVYNNFVLNIRSCFTDMMLQHGFDRTLMAEMRRFLQSLDPVEDERLLEASGDLVKVLIEAIANVEKYSCENPIIIQGDCWCNNVLHLYNEQNQESPADTMLVDWQVLRNGSPAFDLAYFFYSIASEETLDNLDYYLNAYYDELSMRIKQLGSDPQALYPFSHLKKEWKKFAKYAFAQSFFVMKALIADKEEQSIFGEYPEIADREDAELWMPKIRNEHLFLARMKLFLKHFIEHGFLE